MPPLYGWIRLVTGPPFPGNFSTHAHPSRVRVGARIAICLGAEYNLPVNYRTGKSSVVEANARVRAQGARIGTALWATMLLTSLVTAQDRGKQADSQARVDQLSSRSETTVIQGRVTAIEGTVVTVKTPDGYPGGAGGHAQFVTAGPTCRVDVSRARFLLPDGTRADKQPLAVGDRVLVVLSGPVSLQPLPGSPHVSPPYVASVIERVVQGDRIVTH